MCAPVSTNDILGCLSCNPAAEKVEGEARGGALPLFRCGSRKDPLPATI